MSYYFLKAKKCSANFVNMLSFVFDLTHSDKILGSLPPKNFLTSGKEGVLYFYEDPKIGLLPSLGCNCIFPSIYEQENEITHKELYFWLSQNRKTNVFFALYYMRFKKTNTIVSAGTKTTYLKILSQFLCSISWGFDWALKGSGTKSGKCCFQDWIHW